MIGFPRHWQKRGVPAVLLLPLGLLFYLVSWLRRTLYSLGLAPQTRLPVPLIVVGNLVAGGTGKTPVVIALVAALREAGYRPGVVSRGYGGSASHPMAVSPTTDPAVAGDEPVLIAMRTGAPVWIAHTRGAAAGSLLATDPACDVIISDDGLQHYALSRNVEIAVFDERGAGNGWPLPAGPLREPLSRLAGVDIVLYQGLARAPVAHARAFPFGLSGETFYRLDDAGHTASASAFAGRRVLAVAAIGNPERFFAALRRLGIGATFRPFPDHHRFSESDLAPDGWDAILMTEKDAVKCTAMSPSLKALCWVLRVDVELPAALRAAVLQKLQSSLEPDHGP
jgi:tetraacyldisaccharide 4'-kinase